MGNKENITINHKTLKTSVKNFIKNENFNIFVLTIKKHAFFCCVWGISSTQEIFNFKITPGQQLVFCWFVISFTGERSFHLNLIENQVKFLTAQEIHLWMPSSWFTKHITINGRRNTFYKKYIGESGTTFICPMHHSQF